MSRQGLTPQTVPDDAYNATTWNGNTEVPTKNAVRDKIESMSGGGDVVGAASSTNNAVVVMDGTTGKVIKEATIIADGTSFKKNAGSSIGLSSLNTNYSINIYETESRVYNGGLNMGEIMGVQGAQTVTNKNLTSATNTFPTFNQNTTGSAATLTTARNIQTNLASTSAASFNGSANVTPGVTGTLPLGNGGTGQTTMAGIAQEVGKLLMPIGFIYTTTTSTNPGTAIGFGTWAAYGAGRVIVGVGTSDQSFAAAATGGASTHTLTTAEMPSHNHQQSVANGIVGGSAMSAQANNTGGNFAIPNTTQNTGGGGAHNNLQPYVVAYMWQRTA